MSEMVVTIGDVVYEIGNPTKFIVRAFDGSGVLFDTIIDGERKYLGQWVALKTLQRYFIRSGRWDYNIEMESEEDDDGG